MTKSEGKNPKGTRKTVPGGDGPGFDGNAWLMDLAKRVRTVLRATGAEVAHFKMSLVPEEQGTEQNVVRAARPKSDRQNAAGPAAPHSLSPHSLMAAVSLVSSDREPELRRTLDGPLSAGVLTVNLRAEGAPELLAITIQEALKSNPPGVKTKRLAEEAFRPGQPTPTHRVEAV